jgi:hypothetical protein
MLLLLIAAAALAALLFVANSAVRRSARRDQLHAEQHFGLGPDEAQLVGHEIATAERLRREADAATDPAQKAMLSRLADEAEADVGKLRREFDDENG